MLGEVGEDMPYKVLELYLVGVCQEVDLACKADRTNQLWHHLSAFLVATVSNTTSIAQDDPDSVTVGIEHKLW